MKDWFSTLRASGRLSGYTVEEVMGAILFVSLATLLCVSLVY